MGVLESFRKGTGLLIPVFWISFDDTPARCRWDQDIVDLLCPDSLFEHCYEANWWDSLVEGGAVVVFPAGDNEKFIKDLNLFIKPFTWVVLILTSDEGASFPWWNVHHPNIRIWVQYNHPIRHNNSALRFFPIGCPSPTPFSSVVPPTLRPVDVFFAGQINHKQRDEMSAALKDMPGLQVTTSTDGFAQGLDRQAYLKELTTTKAALAPSGPVSADSFRCWEALEAGAVPIVDEGPVRDDQGRSDPIYPKGFWTQLLKHHPLPVVTNWSEAPGEVQRIINTYPAQNNRISVWWQQYKKILSQRMLEDVKEVMSLAAPGSTPMVTTRGTSAITVLIPTSPTPNNPELSHLSKTLASVRSRLPQSEVFIMFDGVRWEQEDRRNDYETYQQSVLWRCNHVWDNVIPFRFDEHLHQAEMTRRTLERVTTPYVLFVEHDTPLHGNIPFSEWVDILADDEFDVIRTYHETVMQPEHLPLMGEQYGDYLQTHQWSQRPHLARTSWYAKTLELYFSHNSRTMIEDKLHGSAQEEPQNFRIALYNPPGNMQTSIHLDARGEDPKYEMTF